MTLIIGHRDGWMVADQMTAFHNERAPIVVEKIVNLGYALLAASGESGFRQHAAKALKGKTARTIVPAIVKHIKDTSQDIQVLIVTKSRRMCFIDEKGCVYDLKPEQDWWAIGSSRDTAKGFLAGWEACRAARSQLVDSVVACRALRYSSTIDAGVGHGIQVENLP